VFLTGDVNAAIRGLIAGGAGDIVVTDAHGSGNSDEPDILIDQMDKRAKFEFRDHPFDPYRDVPDASYQAIVCIAMHARARTPGFMAHTVTLEPAIRVNGLEITETEIIAHSAARFAVPVIMVSGDDVLEQQIHERFPLAEYGLVKRAKGMAGADLLSQEEAHANIERAARRAIEKLASFKPFPVASQYRFEVSFPTESQTDFAALYPGLDRVNQTTLGYVAPTFIEGYDRCLVLIQLVSSLRTRFLGRAVQARSDSKEIMAEFEKLMVTTWLEPEKMPAPPRRETSTKKRYHGDN
jgi:D-amino peptidase